MFICGDGHVFEKPYTNARGTCFCPECGDGFETAYECKCCGKWIEANNIRKDICYKCAEEKYTDRLGLKWLDKHKEYFLDFWGIEKVDKDLETDLIEVLEKDFLSKIDLDADYSKQLKHLKNYILEDIDTWINFLREEI